MQVLEARVDAICCNLKDSCATCSVPSRRQSEAPVLPVEILQSQAGGVFKRA